MQINLPPKNRLANQLFNKFAATQDRSLGFQLAVIAAILCSLSVIFYSVVAALNGSR